MRAPFQVLVIPYRSTASALEFAVLKRSGANYWQFIAGGGEEGETPIQAAQRESLEEIGIAGELIPLDSMATVPRDNFAALGPTFWMESFHPCVAAHRRSRHLLRQLGH
ncbi:MAG: NUDIX domain-containing protein [Anaerolineales bacterium]|nr:NUDIX domain-containing protein [Anaerolineales bacterium]